MGECTDRKNSYSADSACDLMNCKYGDIAVKYEDSWSSWTNECWPVDGCFNSTRLTHVTAEIDRKTTSLTKNQRKYVKIAISCAKRKASVDM